MTTLFIVFQVILVCVICIAVLLQKSSSIGLGAYSGSNESFFGAKGASGFLAKFTFFMGLLLIANTITLSYLYNSAANQSSVAERASELARENNASLIPQAPNAAQIPQSPSQSAAPAPQTAPQAPANSANSAPQAPSANAENTAPSTSAAPSNSAAPSSETNLSK